MNVAGRRLASAGLAASGGLGIGLLAAQASRTEVESSAAPTTDPDIQALVKRLGRLEKRCGSLELELFELRQQTTIVREPREAIGPVVDEYTEWWYARNKHDVDAGVVKLPVIGTKIDLFPDTIEKHMYSTMFKAMVNQILDTEFCVAGVRMRMEPLELHKGFRRPRSTSSYEEASTGDE